MLQLRKSLSIFTLSATMFILAGTPARACHIVAKGVAATLRENMCFRDKTLRHSMNSIIHCPDFRKACKDNRKHQQALLHSECLDFMIRSGMFIEIINLRKP